MDYIIDHKWHWLMQGFPAPARLVAERFRVAIAGGPSLDPNANRVSEPNLVRAVSSSGIAHFTGGDAGDGALAAGRWRRGPGGGAQAAGRRRGRRRCPMYSRMLYQIYEVQ